jgi:hypothetical protein
MQGKLLSTLLLSSSIAAQGLLVYDAGPLITTPGGGFGGANVSELQNGTGGPYNLSMNVLGHGAQAGTPPGNAIADDFTTNGVWIIDGIELFTYQTQGAGLPPNPTITGVFIEIFNGDPSMGGVPIAGSPGIANNLFNTVGYTATNTLTNTYRATAATIATATTRRIQSVRVNFPAPLILDPSVTGTSTYWLEFQFSSTVSTSGPWLPPIAVLGSLESGVAYQRQVAAYVQLVDGGNPVAPVPFKQGAPFKLYGTPTTPAGAFTNLGGGCGAATLAVRGAPHIGGVVHSELSNTQAPLNPAIFPLIIIGVTNQSIPLPCGCVAGPTLDFVYNFAAQPYSNNWQVPVALSGLGLEYYVQGAELDFFGLAAPALNCNFGLGFTFAMTDTYRVKFY